MGVAASGNAGVWALKGLAGTRAPGRGELVSITSSLLCLRLESTNLTKRTK